MDSMESQPENPEFWNNSKSNETGSYSFSNQILVVLNSMF